MTTRALSVVALLAVFAAGCGDDDDDDAVVADASATLDASIDALMIDAGPAPVNPACTVNGCLRVVEHVGDFSKAQVEGFLTTGVVIDNGYSVVTITYFTAGKESKATLTIPFQASAPAGGWHIVVNAHGTSGLDDLCAFAGNVAGAGLSGTFGARGFIGVAADYPGLGTAGVHPYLVSAVEGKSTLDALRATLQYAALNGISVSGRGALVGLSQGGHAVLAAAALHGSYARELSIKAFAAAAPASVWEEQWRAGIQVDGLHVSYHAMAIYAWASHYGWTGPALWNSAMASTIDETMTQHCTTTVGTSEAISSRLGSSAAGIFSTEFLSAYRSGTWGAFSAFGGHFTANRIGPYAQTAPLKIYQGDADGLVLESGTRALVDALRAGGVTVDYEVVPGGIHTDVAFGFVAYQERRTNESIAWLREKLAAN